MTMNNINVSSVTTKVWANNLKYIFLATWELNILFSFRCGNTHTHTRTITWLKLAILLTRNPPRLPWFMWSICDERVASLIAQTHRRPLILPQLTHFPKEKNETQWGNQGVWLAQVTWLLSSHGRSKMEACGYKLGFTFPAYLIWLPAPSF